MALSDFQGVYEHVMQKVGWSTTDTVSLGLAKEAVNDAYEDVCEAYDWRELEKVATINTVADYTTGTVSSSGTTITGSGTTFVAGMAGRKFAAGLGKPFFAIDTFTSTTQIDLVDSWPFTGLSGDTYIIYEDVYSLASDVDKLYVDLVTLHDDNGRQLARLTESAQLHFHDLPSQSGRPEVFWLIEDDSSANKQMQLGFRVPDDVYVIRYKYKRRPTELSSNGDTFLLPEEMLGTIAQGAIALCYELPEFRDAGFAEQAEAKFERMLAKKIRRRRRGEGRRIVHPQGWTGSAIRYPHQLPVLDD